MLQRFVCFKFLEDTPSLVIQQHVDMFASLQDLIPQIVSYSGGRTYLDGQGNEKFDTAHCVKFQSKEDIDLYFHHPAHQKFINDNQDQWHEVLVIDSKVIE